MIKETKIKLSDSENNYLNLSFWNIVPLFNLVKNGDVTKLKRRLHIKLDDFPTGRITKNEQKQLDYLAVSLINTFMIAGIEGGIYPPEANSIADNYLYHLTHINDKADISKIIASTAVHFCQLVKKTKNTDTGNIHVENAKHYISLNLTQDIKVTDIAKNAKVSPYYLSHLFKKLTKKSIREYLIQERIAAAKELLITSNYKISQIASLLCFCDQSYFSKVFRLAVGQTPLQYRNHARR